MHSNVHAPILTFLDMLYCVKGNAGKVALHIVHWMPGGAADCKVVSSRGFTYAGAPVASPPVQSTVSPSRPNSPVPSEDARQLREIRDGVLRIGEHMRFEGRSPLTGYLHLFNLGTSGSCTKITPSAQYPDNLVQAGDCFHLPSEKLLGAQVFPGGAWQETGPASSQSGYPERLLVIVTRENISINTEDLHPELAARDLLTRCASRGPGFSGPVRKDITKLFALPLDSWEYGLLALEVL